MWLQLVLFKKGIHTCRRSNRNHLQPTEFDLEPAGSEHIQISYLNTSGNHLVSCSRGLKQGPFGTQPFLLSPPPPGLLFLQLWSPGRRLYSYRVCCPFCLQRKENKLLTLALSAVDHSACQWARIVQNQIQIWSGNKVNPLYDPATICESVLIIGLFCVLHYELIQPRALMIHANTEI